MEYEEVLQIAHAEIDGVSNEIIGKQKLKEYREKVLEIITKGYVSDQAKVDEATFVWSIVMVFCQLHALKVEDAVHASER